MKKNIIAGILSPLYCCLMANIILYSTLFGKIKTEGGLVLGIAMEAIPGIILIFVLTSDSVKKYFKSLGIYLLSSLVMLCIYVFLQIDVKIWDIIMKDRKYEMWALFILGICYIIYTYCCFVGTIIAGIITIIKFLVKRKRGKAYMENTQIIILPVEDTEKYYNDILEMLKVCDNEFFPPLSARTSSAQGDLSGSEPAVNGVLNYFEELKTQRFAVACSGEKLLGFVSYKENFTGGEVKEEELPNIYISTLIVSPQARGKGLTYKMYEKLFAAYSEYNIFTRTWSTNNSHINILSKFGFETFKVLKDHRGEGIHTIYFKKPKKENK